MLRPSSIGFAILGLSLALCGCPSPEGGACSKDSGCETELVCHDAICMTSGDRDAAVIRKADCASLEGLASRGISDLASAESRGGASTVRVLGDLVLEIDGFSTPDDGLDEIRRSLLHTVDDARKAHSRSSRSSYGGGLSQLDRMDRLLDQAESFVEIDRRVVELGEYCRPPETP